MAECNSDPFHCDGCHSGDFAGFDHLCDVLNVTDAETTQAFAAWLGHRTGWDGPYCEIVGREQC